MSLFPPPNPGTAEPGYLTTEFWVTLGTDVVGFLAAAGVIDQSTAVRVGGLVTMGVGTIFYAISRGLRKQGTPG